MDDSSIILDDALGYANSDYGRNYGLLAKWLEPGSVKQVEFGQNVALQKYMNEWNSEQAKMQRMKEAGINPNLAAKGVSAGSNAPAVASAPTHEAGASLGDVASLVGSVAGVAGTAAEVIDKLYTLKPRTKEIIQNTATSLQQAGKTKIEADILSKQLPFTERKEQLAIASSLANLMNIDEATENLREIRKNYEAQRDEIRKNIDLMGTQMSLNDKLSAQAQANALNLQEATEILKFRVNLMQTLGIDYTMPIANQLVTARLNGQDDVFSSILSAVHAYNYQETLGQLDAEAEKVYSIELDKAKAKADVDAEFAPFFKTLEANKDAYVQIVSAFAKLKYHPSGNMLTADFINAVRAGVEKFPKFDSMGGHSKPHSGPHSSRP